jgi:hydroxymethylpyrimidine/phosphomethylpyrimidine kinase
MTEKQDIIENNKIKSTNHGSGCNYSASMIFALTQGKSVLESAKFAQKFTLDSIKGAQKVGKGIAITHKKTDQRYFELSNAINNFTKIKNISQQIPECKNRKKCY